MDWKQKIENKVNEKQIAAAAEAERVKKQGEILSARRAATEQKIKTIIQPALEEFCVGVKPHVDSATVEPKQDSVSLVLNKKGHTILSLLFKPSNTGKLFLKKRYLKLPEDEGEVRDNFAESKEAVLQWLADEFVKAW